MAYETYGTISSCPFHSTSYPGSCWPTSPHRIVSFISANRSRPVSASRLEVEQRQGVEPCWPIYDRRRPGAPLPVIQSHVQTSSPRSPEFASIHLAHIHQRISNHPGACNYQQSTAGPARRQWIGSGRHAHQWSLSPACSPELSQSYLQSARSVMDLGGNAPPSTRVALAISLASNLISGP